LGHVQGEVVTTIRDELLGLQRGHTVLQVERVVDWAREHPESALHRSLEWNDRTAAHHYRCQQVRRLIAIHVVSDDGVRQLVSLKIDRVAPGGGYRDLSTVMRAPELRRMLLAEALEELDRLRLKYEGLRELAGVWEAADRVRSPVRRHRPAARPARRRREGGATRRAA
jgi:hypothetical protein